jgi:hypothetical protein
MRVLFLTLATTILSVAMSATVAVDDDVQSAPVSYPTPVPEISPVSPLGERIRAYGKLELDFEDTWGKFREELEVLRVAAHYPTVDPIKLKEYQDVFFGQRKKEYNRAFNICHAAMMALMKNDE